MRVYENIQRHMEEQWKESTGKKREVEVETPV